MIDTIVLTLRGNEFRVMDWSHFQSFSQSNKIKLKQAIYNPDVKTEGYKPRLTHIERFGTPELRIEFSAPKLLLGNNFDEIEEKDFDKLIQKIHKCLTESGIGVIPAVLRQAEVTTIHFSKNIILTDHTTSGMILAELGKINLTKWLDVSTRDYRDGGHTLYYSSKTKRFMIVFYDKIKELEQARITDKGRAEKDGIVQMSILEEIKKMEQPFEVLRTEIRFCERRKLKQVLEKLGLQTELRFENLFKQSISKAILQDYWQMIDNGASYLTIDTRKLDRLTERIIKANRGIKPMKALAVSSAIMQINQTSVRRFRSMMKPSMNDRYWYDFAKTISETTQSLRKTNFLAMAQIGKQIEAFETVHLSDYQQLDYICKQK